MALHDAVADGKSEPGPLPHRLRREERLEDAGQDVGRDARSGVRDGHSHPSFLAMEANGDAALRAARERLLGIEHEVQEHLFELGGVSAHERDSGPDLAHHRDAPDAERILAQCHDARDDVAQVHQGHLARARTDEGLQLADDLRRLHAARVDPIHALDMVRIDEPAGQKLGLTHDDGERIVDLVRHAAHELADRGELARLQKLLLRRLDLADARGELGVEAGILERQRRVVGEGLGQVDLLHGELPSLRIADVEHADDGVAHDQGHGTHRADARPRDAVAQIRRHVDPRLGQHVRRRDGLAQRDGAAAGAHARRDERSGREARLKRAAGRDGDEGAGGGIEAKERGGPSAEQMRDAVDGALRHLGGIESAGQLPSERGQRRRPLGLAERGLAAALLGDIALDALDERDEPQAGVGARRGGEAEQDHRRDHGTRAHPRQVLQQDLEEGGEGRDEEDEPVLEGERGQDDEQDVDAGGEARHAARTRARRERGPLQEEHHGDVDQRDGEAREPRRPLARRPTQNSAAATSQYAVKSPRFPVHPGRRRTLPRTIEQREESREPTTRRRFTRGRSDALARQLAGQRVGGGDLLRHHVESIPASTGRHEGV